MEWSEYRNNSGFVRWSEWATSCFVLETPFGEQDQIVRTIVDNRISIVKVLIVLQLDSEMYKQQTLVVESLLTHHPEFDPAVDRSFSSIEAALFREFFQPKWEEFQDDYRLVFEHFASQRPADLAVAQDVLRKWCVVHGVSLDEVGL